MSSNYLQPNPGKFVKFNVTYLLNKSTDMKHWKIYSVVCLTALYLFIVSGCKKEENKDLQIPPTETMVMDLGFTDNNTKSASNSDTTKVYHTAAAMAIAYWSIVAGVQTGIPAAALKEAFNQIPIHKDSVWVWQYIVSVDNATYTASLTGQVKADSVRWAMKISKVGESNLADFLWFTGSSHVARTGGWWMLNYPKSVSHLIINVSGLLITWSITNDRVRYLQYTYVMDSVLNATTNKYVVNANKGGYIKFGLQVDPKYDAYYLIKSMDALQGPTLWQILWNRTTNEGRINKNDAALGCWDNRLFDKASCDSTQRR